MRTYIVWGKKPGDTFIEWNSTVYIVGMLTIAECCWWSTIWSHTWMVLSRTGSVELVNSLGVRFQMLILLVWFLILWDFTKEFIRYNYWFDKCKKKNPVFYCHSSLYSGFDSDGLINQKVKDLVKLKFILHGMNDFVKLICVTNWRVNSCFDFEFYLNASENQVGFKHIKKRSRHVIYWFIRKVEG